MNNRKSLITCIILWTLTAVLLVLILETVKRNSFDAGYQACIEEYNLYLPFE